MNGEIFDNNSNPFTVPDGYLDSLQERILNRVYAEKNKAGRRIFRMSYFRALVAVAACILLIFTAVSLYMTFSSKQSVIAEKIIDDDFYRLIYSLDENSLLAETLDLTMPDNFAYIKTDYSEDDEAIIRFLERENINLFAMLNYLDNEIFYITNP